MLSEITATSTSRFVLDMKIGINSLIYLHNFFPGEPFNVTVKYRHARNYPVDLYYLMDVSMSMEDDKATLSNLAESLAQSIRNITTNFRLGFGVFVDKPILPYISTVPFKYVETHLVLISYRMIDNICLIVHS